MNKNNIKIILVILNIGLIIGIGFGAWNLTQPISSNLLQNQTQSLSSSSFLRSSVSSSSLSRSSFSSRSSSNSSVSNTVSLSSSNSANISSLSFVSSSIQSSQITSSSSISSLVQSNSSAGQDDSLIQKLQSRGSSDLVSVETFQLDNVSYRLLLKVNNDGSIANLAISQLDFSNAIDIESDLFRNFFIASLRPGSQNGVFEIGIAEGNGRNPNITVFSLDITRYI